MPAMVVYMIIATANTYIYVYIYINVSVAICGSSHKRKQICLVIVRCRNALILVEQLAEFVW